MISGMFRLVGFEVLTLVLVKVLVWDVILYRLSCIYLYSRGLCCLHLLYDHEEWILYFKICHIDLLS